MDYDQDSSVTQNTSFSGAGPYCSCSVQAGNQTRPPSLSEIAHCILELLVTIEVGARHSRTSLTTEIGRFTLWYIRIYLLSFYVTITSRRQATVYNIPPVTLIWHRNIFVRAHAIQRRTSLQHSPGDCAGGRSKDWKVINRGGDSLQCYFKVLTHPCVTKRCENEEGAERVSG